MTVAAWRRLRGAGRELAALLLGWLVATLAGGLLPALALDHLTRALPGGSAELTFPGGAVALDAFVQGRGTLSTALSTALGAAVCWGLLVEPFLRAALLCRLGRCGADCPARAGVLARGAKHFLRLFALQLVQWSLLLAAAAALLLSRAPAWLALPGVWLTTSVLGDLAAVALVAGRGVYEGLRRFAALLRDRPVAAVFGGAALRLLALLPLGVLGLLLAAGPGASPVRALVMLLLPAPALVVRAWWWALATELEARSAALPEHARWARNVAPELDSGSAVR